jgi:hypothetical protein
MGKIFCQRVPAIVSAIRILNGTSVRVIAVACGNGREEPFIEDQGTGHGRLWCSFGRNRDDACGGEIGGEKKRRRGRIMMQRVAMQRAKKMAMGRVNTDTGA